MPSPAKKTAHKRRKKDATYKKAPGAPKRFKSSYIHFFMHVHNSVKSLLPPEEATAPLISKRASSIWKNLPASERKYWDDIAADEKKIYLEQKKVYKGPWKVLNRRAKKDPSAPKRNPSAFLLFASTRRSALQDKFPHLDNTAISRILGKEWRAMASETKNLFVERERYERASYKELTIQWKKQQELKNAEDVEFASTQSLPITYDQNKDFKMSIDIDDLIKKLTLEKFLSSQETPTNVKSMVPNLSSPDEEGEVAKPWEGKELYPRSDLLSSKDGSNSYHAREMGNLNRNMVPSKDPQLCFRTLEETMPRRGCNSGGTETYPTCGLRRPNEVQQDSPNENTSSYDMEESIRRLEETWVHYKDRFNEKTDLHSEPRTTRMRSNGQVDFLTQSRRSSLTDGSLENELLPFRSDNFQELFLRLNGTSPVHKDPPNVSQSDFLSNTPSLCSGNLEGSFRILEERVGLREETKHTQGQDQFLFPGYSIKKDNEQWG